MFKGKGNRKGRQGKKKKLLKCDLQHMFSGRICPEEAKVVLKPYYFKKLQVCAEHACKLGCFFFLGNANKYNYEPSRKTRN